MAIITESQALAVVGLAHMKDELRIEATETSHDALLTRQIHDAANYAARTTGVVLADLPALRPAIVAAVRQQYDGFRELKEDSAVYGWMDPFRSYKT